MSDSELFLNVDELVFDEDIDMNSLRIILDNFDVLFCKGKIEGVHINGKHEKETDKTKCFDMLKSLYVSRRESNKGQVGFKNNKNIGRYFGQNSIQFLPRNIRHALCKDLYYDIDIVNCQASVMLNIMKQYDIDHKNFLYYINNRDECLKFFMDNLSLNRDDAKNIFIVVMNGGKRTEAWFKKNYPAFDIKKYPAWLKGLHSEVVLFYDTLTQVEDDEEIHRVITLVQDISSAKEAKGTKIYSDVGSFVSFYCQTQECKIISTAIKFFKSKGCHVSTPFFDGVHIYKDTFPGEELLREAEKVIKDKLGFEITFKIKPMDEGLNLDGLSVKEENNALYSSNSKKFNYSQLIGEFTHYNIAKIFSENYSDNYIYCDKQWFERNEFNIWKNRDEEPLSLRKNIHNFFETKLKEYKTIIKAKKEKAEKSEETKQKKAKKGKDEGEKVLDKCILSLGNSSFKDGIIKELKIFFNKPEILEKMDQNIHIFPFENGCIDLADPKLPFRKIKIDDYVSITCGYNYSDVCDTETKTQIMKTFREMFLTEEDTNFALTCISSCFRGVNFFEKFFNFVGSGRNGKSLFFDACERVFGNFFGIIPIEWFYTYSCKDSSRGSAEMDKIVHSRVFYCTEGENNNGEKLALDKIKRITGGDKISYRKVYGRKQINFTPKGTLFFNTNKIPEVNEKNKEEIAFVERFVVHKFPYTFKTGVDETEGLVKKADPKIKDQFKREDKFRDALLHILLEFYRDNIFGKTHLEQPKSSKEATNAFLNEEKNLISTFLSENYIVDEKERVSEDQVFNEFCDSVKKVSKATFSKIARECGYQTVMIHGYSNIKAKHKSADNNCESESVQLSGRPPM
jgi:phage/plasmid-associated DNA primase